MSKFERYFTRLARYVEAADTEFYAIEFDDTPTLCELLCGVDQHSINRIPDFNGALDENYASEPL